MSADLTHYPGYAPGAKRPVATTNQRNDKIARTVLVGDGRMRLETPLDRAGRFEPLLSAKPTHRYLGRQARETGIDRL